MQPPVQGRSESAVTSSSGHQNLDHIYPKVGPGTGPESRAVLLARPGLTVMSSIAFVIFTSGWSSMQTSRQGYPHRQSDVCRNSSVLRPCRATHWYRRAAARNGDNSLFGHGKIDTIIDRNFICRTLIAEIPAYPAPPARDRYYTAPPFFILGCKK